MSSFNAFGFFALASGQRIATSVPGANHPIHHIYYSTTLKTDDGQSLSATLRTYSAAGDAPLPDNTIVFVIAKVLAPVGKAIELDSLVLAAIPGDVNAVDYQDHIPDCPTYLYGVGHIPANHTPQVLADGGRTFTVNVAEYVGGGLKNSTIQCMYTNKRRWANVPVPHSQSCFQFLGTCTGFSETGSLRLTVEHVTLSLGPHTLAQPASTSVTSTPSTTPLKQKYVAFGSTSVGSSTTSTSQAGPSNIHSSPSVTQTQAHQTTSSVVHETRSKKRAASASLSPIPGSDDDTADETVVKGKGKKKAKQ